MSYMAPVPYLVYDIETAANERAPEYFRNKKYEAPANYKDPVKIEEAIREKRGADIDKAALQWWTGRVTSISCYPLHCPPTVLAWTASYDNEKQLLTEFFTVLSKAHNITNGHIVLCGKRSDDFDAPYLVGRALVHDLGIPDALRGWRKMTDIELIFGHSMASSQRCRLDDMAFALGIPGKTGTGRGALDLWNLILSGDPDARGKLCEYNAHDTRITAEVLRRWLKTFSVLDAGVVEEHLEIPFG